MSKKKLDLKGLKVKSFVTSMDEAKENTAKGGAPALLTHPPCIINTAGGCVSQFIRCISQFCPTKFICPTEGFCPTEAICPSVGFCPSELGCPSDFCPTDPF